MSSVDLSKINYYGEGGVLSQELDAIFAARDDIKRVTESVAAAGFKLQNRTLRFESQVSEIGLKPGLYVIFGGAGAGKSTAMRTQFDKQFLASYDSKFVAIKGGEPEHSGWVKPVEVARAISSFIADDKHTVATVDSIARLLDYDLVVPKLTRKAVNDLSGNRRSGSQQLEDPVERALDDANATFNPATNTKTTGLSGSFLHLVFTWDALLAKAGKYAFAIVNAGLSDSADFRSTITGLVSGVFQLDSTDSSLVRVVPILEDKKLLDLWRKDAIYPFSRCGMISTRAVDAGKSGSASAMLPGVIPGTVTESMIGGDDV